jgi:hypothetical protein
MSDIRKLTKEQLQVEGNTVEIETPQALHIADVGRSLFNHIRNRIDRLDEELERVNPFSQAELNLGYRKSKLIKALKTLGREGLL